MLDHFLLTRFNIASGGREASIRSQADWLPGRMELFERYCLPCVLAQSIQDFKWIIYFDSETPAEFMKLADQYTSNNTYIRYVSGEEFNPETVKRDIRNFRDPNSQWVLTTRLDNDDSIASTFFEDLRENIEFDGRKNYNFTNGLTLSQKGVYLCKDYSNAFISMMEPVEEMKTVWCAWHTQLSKIAPVVQIHGAPRWLQVIHGGNVSNAIRGHRVPADQHLARFNIRGGIDFEDRDVDFILDRFLCAPIRDIRDAGKKFAKQVLVNWRHDGK